MALIKCPECGKEISDKALCCTNCGCPREMFPSIFDFEENEDGGVSICKMNDEFLNDFLIIPDCDNKGRKITAIKSGAIKGNNIVSIKIGKNVSRIEEGAFDQCENLVEFHVDRLVDWLNISFALDFGEKKKENSLLLRNI